MQKGVALHGRTFFGAVESTRNLSKVQDVSAKWHGNIWNVDKPNFLEVGLVSWKCFGFSPRDFDFVEV